MTQGGLFEPTVMFFGLKNSPPTFQQLMDDVIHEHNRIKEPEASILIKEDATQETGTIQNH